MISAHNLHLEPCDTVPSPNIATNRCRSSKRSNRKRTTRSISEDTLKDSELASDVVAHERDEEPVEISSRPIYPTSWQDIDDEQNLRKCLIRNIQEVSDHNEHSNVDSAAGSTVSSERSTTTENSSPATVFSTLKTSRKGRRRDEDAVLLSEESNARVFKRPKHGPRSEPETSLRLACPYYKRDPRKYNIHVHRVCATRHWDSVSRVKFVS
jgi:hypothetical protein